MNTLPYPYSYENKYIALNLPVRDGMPKTISVGGYELLLKSEFHISLIKVSYVLGQINASNPQATEDEIVELFAQFIKKQPLDTYKPLKQFRFVQLDERKTLVGVVDVPHINEFFELLRSTYATNIPTQATHITMYTLQPEAGIGILSQEQMDRDSLPVELPEFENIQFVPVPK